MREWDEYCNDGWMFLNKRPTMMCLAKTKQNKQTKKQGRPSCLLSPLTPSGSSNTDSTTVVDLRCSGNAWCLASFWARSLISCLNSSAVVTSIRLCRKPMSIISVANVRPSSVEFFVIFCTHRPLLFNFRTCRIDAWQKVPKRLPQFKAKNDVV